MHPTRWHFTFSDVGGAVDGRPHAAFFGQAVEELELLNQLRSKHFRSPRQRLVRLFGHLERTTGTAAPCAHTLNSQLAKFRSVHLQLPNCIA